MSLLTRTRKNRKKKNEPILALVRKKVLNQLNVIPGSLFLLGKDSTGSRHTHHMGSRLAY